MTIDEKIETPEPGSKAWEEELTRKYGVRFATRVRTPITNQPDNKLYKENEPKGDYNGTRDYGRS